jgi:DNA integrity scanning protein DisA with diadenylate cyclase activity
MNQFDIKKIVQMIIKYMIEGFTIAIAAYYIPTMFSNGFIRPGLIEILSIGSTAALIMAVLDQYASVVGTSFRQGAGFGMGFKLVGGKI